MVASGVPFDITCRPNASGMECDVNARIHDSKIRFVKPRAPLPNPATMSNVAPQQTGARCTMPWGGKGRVWCYNKKVKITLNSAEYWITIGDCFCVRTGAPLPSTFIVPASVATKVPQVPAPAPVPPLTERPVAPPSSALPAAGRRADVRGNPNGLRGRRAAPVPLGFGGFAGWTGPAYPLRVP